MSGLKIVTLQSKVVSKAGVCWDNANLIDGFG